MWTYLLVACTLAAVCFPLYQHEIQRHAECESECAQRALADTRLLQSRACRDPRERLLYAEAGTVDCAKAEKRMERSVAQCAWHKWRAESEVARIWGELTHSYYTLLGLVLPLCAWAMYLAVSYWKHQAQLSALQQYVAPPPVYLPALPRRHYEPPLYIEDVRDEWRRRERRRRH